MFEFIPDYHPVLVHFPIALLMTYSVFELISIRALQEKPYWFYVKAILAIVGAMTAVAAFLSGYFFTSERLPGDPLQTLHLRFAIASLVIFGFIALLYILAWSGGPKTLLFTSKFLFNRGVMIPLALAGIIAMFITGGLGGAIVYGVRFDPIMSPIFRYFNLL